MTSNEAEMLVYQTVLNVTGGNLSGLRAAYHSQFPSGGPSIYYNFASGGSSFPLLSTTRAHTGFTYTYRENAAGLLIPFAANVAPITDKGLSVFEGRTKVVLWPRDLTNAVWTASNVTVAKDQVGADGVANSASSLTATAGNGTVLQAITLASSARAQSAYVKRLVGSGTINMTMDNGATWTAITVTSSYTKVTIPTQTLANPTVGFRIVTSGDSIAVDFVNNENGTFATPPVDNTSANGVVGADVISLTGAAATAALNAKAMLAKIGGSANGAATSPRIVEWGGASRNISLIPTTQVRISNGTNNADATIGGAGVTSGVVTAAFGFDATSITSRANAGTQAISANAMGALSGTVYIGNRSAGDRALNGYLQRIAFSNTKGAFDAMTA